MVVSKKEINWTLPILRKLGREKMSILERVEQNDITRKLY
jgi:hypothetical protein